MVSTRSSATSSTTTTDEEAFLRAVVDVMGKKADSPVAKALKANGIETAHDLVQCMDEDFATLAYEEDGVDDADQPTTKRTKTLVIGDHRCLLWFKHFLIKVSSEIGDLSVATLESTTRNSFNEFRTKGFSSRP